MNQRIPNDKYPIDYPTESPTEYATKYSTELNTLSNTQLITQPNTLLNTLPNTLPSTQYPTIHPTEYPANYHFDYLTKCSSEDPTECPITESPVHCITVPLCSLFAGRVTWITITFKSFASNAADQRERHLDCNFYFYALLVSSPNDDA